jgi:GNAT superfamily N-acetyltransferase
MSRARTKGRGKPGRGPEAGPYSRLLAAALREARRLGLYVLSEGPGDDPAWRVYERQGGRCVLSFWPLSRRWVARGRSGRCRGFRQALRLAGDLGRKAEASDHG